MASKGEIQTYPRGHTKVSSNHIPNVDNKFKYDFPLEGFPYVGRVPSQLPLEKNGPMLPHGYTTLAKLVLGTPNASYLYQNPIQSSNAMPTSGPCIPSMTSQIPVKTIVTSVLIQPTIPSQPLLSFQPSILVQSKISVYTPVSSSVPPSSGKNVPPSHSQPRVKNQNFPLVSSGTHVSGTQPHMVGVNQPNPSGTPNPIDPYGVGNIQYQQPYITHIPLQ